MVSCWRSLRTAWRPARAHDIKYVVFTGRKWGGAASFGVVSIACKAWGFDLWVLGPQMVTEVANVLQALPVPAEGQKKRPAAATHGGKKKRPEHWEEAADPTVVAAAPAPADKGEEAEETAPGSEHSEGDDDREQAAKRSKPVASPYRFPTGDMIYKTLATDKSYIRIKKAQGGDGKCHLLVGCDGSMARHHGKGHQAVVNSMFDTMAARPRPLSKEEAKALRARALHS